jgi:hypothetical protein
MAGIEVIGFPFGAQPAYLRLDSIARSVPLRVAHSPPPEVNPFVLPHQLRTASKACPSTHLSTFKRAVTCIGERTFGHGESTSV